MTGERDSSPEAAGSRDLSTGEAAPTSPTSGPPAGVPLFSQEELSVRHYSAAQAAQARTGATLVVLREIEEELPRLFAEAHARLARPSRVAEAAQDLGARPARSRRRASEPDA